MCHCTDQRISRSCRFLPDLDPQLLSLGKPLYKATKRGEWEPEVWGAKQKKAFKKIDRALTNSPAPGLPDVIKPFFPYVHERLGAVGVLTQL
jgi:hypothetical protein